VTRDGAGFTGSGFIAVGFAIAIDVTATVGAGVMVGLGGATWVGMTLGLGVTVRVI